MAKLRGKEAEIVKMYKQNNRITEIANKCKVHTVTIQRLLHKQKIPVNRRNIKPRKSNYNMKKREYSPELITKMKENTRTNDKYIKYIRFEHSTADQRLVDNILSRPVIG